MKTINASAEELETVRALLRRFLPGREVRAFGSRVAGPAKKFSDLDLVVMGDLPPPSCAIADLKEAFSESDLPFKVDVVEWAGMSEAFRRIIERDNVAVQNGG